MIARAVPFFLRSFFGGGFLTSFFFFLHVFHAFDVFY